MGNMQWGNSQTLGGSLLNTIVEADPAGPMMPKLKPITHDPMDGFPNGRKPRVMVATKEEMYSARISPEFRDYCAHKLIAFKDCRYRKFPFVVLCSHEFHEYQQCEYEDMILRLKEAEREKRLKERDEKLRKQGLPVPEPVSVY